MKARLLDYLACPTCYKALELAIVEEKEQEIVEGSLSCSQCKQTYPITRGVPRFVTELSTETQKTSEAFGWQWTHFTEMHDTFEKQFLDWIYPIQPSFFKDKCVLDAGCGIGRHMYYAAQYGSKDVIGLDVSAAVETCYAAVASKLPNAHVVQANLLMPPFLPETFDFDYSIGVLHHLPDPKAGFKALLPTVKPGGTIFAWVYGYENNGIVHYFIDPLRRRVTTHLPYRVLTVIAFLITIILQITAKGIYKPLNRIGIKFLPSNDYLCHLAEFDFRKDQTIVFDHLVAPIAFYLKREDFEAWFTSAKLTDIEISWRNQNSWRGRGVKA